MGISQAIIQRDEITKEEASSLFFFNLITALILGVALFITSEKIAVIFNIPELTFLLKITSSIVIIQAPALIVRAFLQKSLEFKVLSLEKMLRSIVLIVSTLIMLVVGFGVTGVILGQIISLIFSVVFILYFSKKNKLMEIGFHFNIYKIIPFLKFGGFIAAKQIMTHITIHADELIIGYFLSPEVLGVYHFAKSMLEKIRSLITSSFSKVLFPVMAKLKGDKRRLALGYKKISKNVAILSCPIFIGMALTAHLFVPVLFGEEWVASIPFFRGFSLTLMLLVLTSNISHSLLYSIGKADLVFYIDLLTNPIYIILLILFANYGAMNVLYIYSAYIIAKVVLLQYYSGKFLLYSVYEYLSIFKYASFSILFMIGAVLFAQNLTKGALTVKWQLIISIIIGATVYIIGIILLEKKTLYEIQTMIFKKKK